MDRRHLEYLGALGGAGDTASEMPDAIMAVRPTQLPCSVSRIRDLTALAVVLRSVVPGSGSTSGFDQNCSAVLQRAIGNRGLP